MGSNRYLMSLHYYKSNIRLILFPFFRSFFLTVTFCVYYLDGMNLCHKNGGKWNLQTKKIFPNIIDRCQQAKMAST
jgi:hypothetical protein